MRERESEGERIVAEVRRGTGRGGGYEFVSVRLVEEGCRHPGDTEGVGERERCDRCRAGSKPRERQRTCSISAPYANGYTLVARNPTTSKDTDLATSCKTVYPQGFWRPARSGLEDVWGVNIRGVSNQLIVSLGRARPPAPDMGWQDGWLLVLRPPKRLPRAGIRTAKPH